MPQKGSIYIPVHKSICYITCTIAIELYRLYMYIYHFDACTRLAKRGKKHLKRSSSTTLYGQRDKKLRRAGNSSLIWSARIQLSFFLVPYQRRERLRRGTIWLFAVVIGFCSLNFPFHVDAFDVIYGFIKVFNFRCSAYRQVRAQTIEVVAPPPPAAIVFSLRCLIVLCRHSSAWPCTAAALVIILHLVR